MRALHQSWEGGPFSGSQAGHSAAAPAKGLPRAASDLQRLFGDIGTSMTIEQEATGVNLFAVISA